MIHDFYQNTREEIKELDAQICNFDTEMQSSKSAHYANIASHMQKVKHLECEHLQSCKTVQTNGAIIMNEQNVYHD